MIHVYFITFWLLLLIPHTNLVIKESKTGHCPVLCCLPWVA